MNNNRTTAMTAVLGIILILAAGGLFFCGKSNNETILSADLRAINNARSSEPIQFDIAKDSQNNLYIGWSSEKKGYYIQKSADCGNTWSQPFNISSDSVRATRYSELIAVGNTICAFGIYRDSNTYIWGHNGAIGADENGGLAQRLSTDNGATWADERKVLSSSDLLAGGRITSFVMSANDDTLYMVYKLLNRSMNGTAKSGTYFTKSGDMGLHWEKPSYLYLPEIGDLANSNYSMAINNRTIHLIFMPRDGANSMNHPLYYVRGFDLGTNWENGTFINISRYSRPDNSSGALNITPAPSSPRIIASGSNLIIAFIDWGLYYIKSDDGGDSWGNRNTIAEKRVYNYSFYSRKDDELLIAWVDTRNQVGTIMSLFDRLIPSDASYGGENDDVFTAVFKGGKLGDAVRITPPHSYSENVKCTSIGDSTVLVWSGKRQIGEHVMNSPAPYEIFVKTLK